MSRTLILISLGALVFLTPMGCEDKKATPKPRLATTMPAREPDVRTMTALLDKQGAPATATPSSKLPAGHPPMGGMPAPKGDGLPSGHPPIGGEAPGPAEPPKGSLKFTPPAAWKEVGVTSAMRKAQFTLPKAAGDSEDGQLIVFYFGPGQGGSIEPNIERWKGMFTTADGKPVGDEAMKRKSMEVGGMKVTTVDISGRYQDAPMGRPDPAGPTSKDYRMLAAIVETPEGPWFFKATGPTATIAGQVSNFDEFVKSVHN